MIIIQILPALNNGGVERGTVDLANFLARQGHVSIVISAAGAMLDKLSDNVKHINLNIGKKSLLTLLKINQLKSIFIETKVDIVHARSRLPAWLAYKAISKIKSNKPKFVTTVHGLYSIKKYSSIMARGDRVISVSKTANDYIVKNYNRYLKVKPTLIYRGVDIKEFSFGYKPDHSWIQSIYQQHTRLQGHKLVLLPGRLSAIKGVKQLSIWLHKSTHNAKLILTAHPSNDSYTQRLNDWFREQKIEQKIIWIGVQSNMASLYALVDLVINVSTRPESFGRTVAESLATGTPVVAYNHGGVGEILDQVFPQGKVTLNDQQQLSDTIDLMLSTQPKVKNIQPFQLTDMLDKTLNLYKKTVNEI
ncbi:MAG: glycosyltransferase [Marinicellaceae bacterium]